MRRVGQVGIAGRRVGEIHAKGVGVATLQTLGAHIGPAANPDNPRRRASNDPDAEPDVVLASCGDVPTLEALAAAAILRERLVDLKVRFVNVVDLYKMRPASEHPHGLGSKDFDELFTRDKPVIFAFHA